MPKLKAEHIQKMKVARTARLGKKSPRQVGHEKAMTTLRWIYKWGWSSATILQRISGDNRNGLISRLVRQGRLVRTRTQNGGGQHGIPSYTLTLTDVGLNEVESELDEVDDLLAYELNPHRIDQGNLRHDNLAQSVTADALLAGKISDYITERELKQKSQANVKEFDVIWVLEHLRIGVEIELTAKWHRSLHKFVHGCVSALRCGPDDKRARLDLLVVISDSHALLKHYQDAFAAGQTYHIWEKNQRGHWQIVDSHTVPRTVQEKISWKHVERH